MTVILADLSNSSYVFFWKRGGNVNESFIELTGDSNPGNLARGITVDATKQKLGVRTHNSFNLFRCYQQYLCQGHHRSCQCYSYQGNYCCHHCDDPPSPNSPKSSAKHPTQRGHVKMCYWLNLSHMSDHSPQGKSFPLHFYKERNIQWQRESSSVNTTYLVSEEWLVSRYPGSTQMHK